MQQTDIARSRPDTPDRAGPSADSGFYLNEDEFVDMAAWPEPQPT